MQLVAATTERFLRSYNGHLFPIFERLNNDVDGADQLWLIVCLVVCEVRRVPLAKLRWRTLVALFVVVVVVAHTTTMQPQEGHRTACSFAKSSSDALEA